MSFSGRVDAFDLDLMWSTRLRCRALVKTRGELRTTSASTRPRSSAREKDVTAACSGRASRGRACRIKPKMRPSLRRSSASALQLLGEPSAPPSSSSSRAVAVWSRPRRRRECRRPRTRRSRGDPCHKKTRPRTLREKKQTAVRVGRAPREHARGNRPKGPTKMRPSLRRSSASAHRFGEPPRPLPTRHVIGPSYDAS